MANVLNRTTKQYLTSVNTPDYDPEHWIISPDLSNVQGVPVEYWKIVGDSVVEMSPEEKDAVDSARLDSLKRERIEQVDEKSRQIASNIGFEFPPKSGFRFSLAPQAQIMIIGIYQSRDVISYPINFNTLDGKRILPLENATDVTGFYLTALGTFKGIQDSGTQIKQLIRAATTKAELDAIVDNR